MHRKRLMMDLSAAIRCSRRKDRCWHLATAIDLAAMPDCELHKAEKTFEIRSVIWRKTVRWQEVKMRRLWVWLWFVFLALFVFAGTVVLVIRGKEIAALLHEEVFKLLAQLVILAGIGGLGHVILTEINTSRERREANRKLLQTALSDIVGVYNEVKCVRRLLRAEAVRPNVTDGDAYVLKEAYVALLRRLNEAQLKLEAQLRLIEGNKTQYPEPERLRKCLGDAEGYLGNLISEWERRLGSLSEAPEQNKLADFGFLRCFLGKAKHCFRSGFADPVTEVFAIIGRAIGK